MSQGPDPATLALITEARAQFAATLPAKATAVLELLGRRAWDGARRAAHRLRGSAGTYGFAEVGAAAASLEEGLLEAGGAPSPQAAARLEALARDVQAAADRAAGGTT